MFNTVDTFSFSSNTTASDHGDISQARAKTGGVSSSTHGYTVGGDTDMIYDSVRVNTIDRYAFASNVTATDHGDLSAIKDHPTGQSQTDNGYVAGGNSPAMNVIDKFSHSSNTTASDHGDLSVARFGTSGHQY